MGYAISVILPVYQVENYIENSVRSVCEQDFTDYEIILVDDGTKDNSIEKAKSVLRQYDKPWSVIKQRNSGVSSARNAGMKNASGEFLICIDPDDCIERTFLNKLYSACISNMTDVAFCNWRHTTDKELLYFPAYKEIFVDVYKQDKLFYDFLLRKIIIISPCILIRRSAVAENNLFYNEDTAFSEDVHFIWQVIMAIGRISHVKAVLYNYLIRNNSTMTGSSVNKILTGYNIFRKMHKNLIKSNYHGASMVLPRWIIGTLNSGTRMLEFEEFKSLAKKLNYRHHLKELIRFPDLRIKVLTIILFIHLKLFYILIRNIRVNKQRR